MITLTYKLLIPLHVADMNMLVVTSIGYENNNSLLFGFPSPVYSDILFLVLHQRADMQLVNIDLTCMDHPSLHFFNITYHYGLLSFLSLPHDPSLTLYLQC